MTHPHHGAASPATPEWVAGLAPALATTTLADHVALTLASALVDTRPADLVVATHLVPTAPGVPAFVSLSLSGSGDLAPVLDAALALCLGSSAAESADEIGVAAPGRCTGLPGLAAGAAAVRERHRTGAGGRAVVFPCRRLDRAGSPTVPDVVPVRELLATTAIRGLRVLGGGAAGLDDVVRTHGHLRPVLTPHGLVLEVQPAAGGELVPFENPSPTPCCAGH